MTDTTAEVTAVPDATVSEQAELLRIGMDSLRRGDPELATLLDSEVGQQRTTLAMIASASIADPSVLAAAGVALANVTAEGYPGARYHSGAAQFDQVENLTVERAKQLFGARYANVQPHSCTSANLAVPAALIPPVGTLLGLDLDAGGHLTHGAPASVTGRHHHAVHYGLDSAGHIDFAQVAELVLVDVYDRGLTGVVAERALEECGILANRNRIPGDVKPPEVTSGLRLGTNILAQRGMGPDQMGECAYPLPTAVGR